MTRLKRRKELAGKTQGDIRFGTPQEVAQYRAQRLCKHADTIIEVGAGAGFQTRAFAALAKRVIAIDIDEERLHRGVFAHNVTLIAGDALDPAVLAKIAPLAKGKIAVFLDPQRPAQSKARSLAEIEPNIEKFLAAYGVFSPDIAIELPPFLDPLQLPPQCEREYLSVDGELNRLTVYFGALRTCEVSVVALPSQERIEHTGPLPAVLPIEMQGRFVLEPDRALERAGLIAKVIPTARPVSIGKRTVYLVDALPQLSFATSYVVRSTCTPDAFVSQVAMLGVGKVVLHGSMSQEEQSTILRSLRGNYSGDRIFHVFCGSQFFVTERCIF